VDRLVDMSPSVAVFPHPLLLGHGDSQQVCGVGTGRRVARHLDCEVTQRGIALSLERDFRLRVPVLDKGVRGIEGHSLRPIGERERDVPVEVLASIDADRDVFRFPLEESG